MKKKLWKDILSKNKNNIILSLILYSIVIYTSIKIPFLLGNVIHDLEINHIEYNAIFLNLIWVILLYAAWNFTSYLLDIIFFKLNKNIENDLRVHCYKNILTSNYSNHINTKDAEIIQKIINDTSKVEKAFSNIFQLIVSLVHSLAIIIIMLALNIKLTAIILSIFCLIIIIQKLTTKPLKDLYRLNRQSEEDFLIELKNILNGIFTIKLFNLEEGSISLLNAKNKTNIENNLLIEKKISLIKNFNLFLSSLFRISAVFVGAFLYIMKEINIGVIFSMYTYSIQLASQLRTIIETDIIIKNIIVSYKRVLDFSDEFSKEEINMYSLEEIEEITFKDVSFSYKDKEILKQITFTAEKDNIIGIKGSNGKGKTTLTYLISGILKSEGIFYNNISRYSLTEKEILKRISYIQQTVQLFPVSVYENISLFGKHSRDNVVELCKALNIHEKIMNLENGYDTVINEKTTNLSGGEKQLISIARGLLKESDILILDEINSNLDNNMEEIVFKNIKKYFEQKIVFIISHNKKIYDRCDYIIDLDKQIISGEYKI